MTNSNTRPRKGTRSLARSKAASATGNRIRAGLLGSTALIAVGLAASPAFAQVTVVSPTGGGTITRTQGSNPTVNNQTASGGSLLITNVTQSTDLTVNGVTINNTTGSSVANALEVRGSTSGLNSTGLLFTGVNSLTTTVAGGAALFMSTNANMGLGFTSSGSVFTGSYGVNMSAPGGYISLDSSGHSQSFVANGTAIAGINAISAINASILIGGSSITGFATGVNAQNLYGAGFVSTGGTISASGTGVRLDATGGQNSVNSQSAITAATGIHSTAAGDMNGTSAIVTSGAGRINSTAAGTGTGILATSAGFLAIDAGAAIGDTTRFGTGINATATRGVNVTATAAINANNGIVVSSAGPISVITSGAGTINGSGTGVSVTGTTTSATTAVTIGAAIGGTTAPSIGVAISTGGGLVTFSNTAAITGTTAGLRFTRTVGPTSGTINIGADIIGGIDASAGLGFTYTVAQGATVSGLVTSSFGTGAIVTNSSNTQFTNSGTIISTGGGTDNAGLLHLSGGSTINTATGVISGRTGVSGAFGSAPTTNAGSIIGTGTTSTEAGISSNGGLITNSGSISGGYSGIRTGSNTLTLNNQATGTTTGAVNGVSNVGSGQFTITNAGVIETLGGIAGTGSSGILLSSTTTLISTLTNSGTVRGGGDATNGFGLNVMDGALTLTNQSGGLITGGTGAIRLASDDLATLNLNAGSTVTGSIISTSTGARTTTLAGLLTGAYDASGGTGIDTFTLASTGSVTGAINLGAGDDIFNWQGGAFTTVNAGSGTNDIFNSTLGAGVTRTLDQSTLSGFESYRHLSGTLVVDGSRSVGDSWQVTAGASIDLAGSITSLSGTGQAITVNGSTAGSTVNIRSGATINAYNGVWFNGGGVYTFANAGTMTATGGYAVLSNGATTFNNSGSISAAQSYAVFFGGGLSNVTNSGVIAGGSDATTGIGIRGGSGGLTLTNTASGILAGNVNAINSASGLTTITNAGRIGTGSVTGGVFTAGGTGDGISALRATITNSGTISGYIRGIGLTGTGVQSIVNTGLIQGGQGDGVTNWGVLTMINAQGATVGSDLYAGVVYYDGASGTLTNAGSLIGGSYASSAAGFQTFTTGAVTFNNYGSSTGTGGGIISFGTGAITANLFAGSTTGDITLGGANDVLSLYSGRGSSGGAVVDAGTGLTLQNAGTLAGAITGAINMGGGTNTINLRGTGDGTAGNGVGGTLTLTGIGGLGVLTKMDTGTWLVNGDGAGLTTINAGVGGGAAANGLLILNGTGLTSAININGATVRAMTAASLGTGTITMVNPTLQFAATGTYGNNMVLAASSPTTDPTNLQTFGTGVTATLSGAITQQSGGQPLVFSSVDTNGAASTGAFVLTNTGNNWTGVTTIMSGTTLSGAFNTISGGSIVNDGRLIYTGGAGSVAQNITGSGSFTRNGTGALTLTGVNNWFGLTTIQSGELRGTTGSISGSGIVNNGVLTYVNTTAGTATQGISGTGVIDIAGTAATTLNGSIVTSGTLSVSGTGSSLILGGSRGSATGAADSGYGSGVLVSGTNAGVTINGTVTGGSFVGVRVTGQGGFVTNFGAITNTGTGGADSIGAGVAIYTMGGSNTVTNGSIVNTTASIRGQNNAINQRSFATTALTVNNFGLLAGSLYSAIENSGNAGLLTVNNSGAGATIVGQGNAGGGNGIAANSVSGLNLTNSGRIIGRTVGVSSNGFLTLNNSGTIGSGTLTGGTSGSYNISGQYGVVSNAGGSITNQVGGLIRGGSLAGVYATGTTTLVNAGTITSNGFGGVDAVTVIGRATITNSGTIASALTGGSGIAVTGAGSVITNSGTITGSNNATYGFGVQNAAGSGLVTITNQSGGVIGGGMGSILLNGGGDTNINLEAGSTANGQILSYANGTHNLTVAGTLNGAYNAASGSGVDNITLTATGSMTSVNLGAGADSFNWQGGAFSGGLEGGAGSDTFNTNLGALNRSLNLTAVTGFETLNHNSGGLTLTGTGAFGGGVSVNGGVLTVNGALQGDTLVGSGGTLGGSGAIDGVVTIANNGVLSGVQGSTLTMGGLVLDASSIVDATFTGVGGPALFAIDNDLTLDGVLNVSHTGAFGFGVYGLMTYGGALTDLGLTIGTTPGGSERTLVQTAVAGEVNLVHAPNSLLFWDGGTGHDNGVVNGGTGTWTAAGTEWTDANGIYNGAMQPQPGFAIFQGAGGVVTVDDVNGAIGVTGIQFAANGYRIQGDSIDLAAPTTTIRVGNGTAAGAGYVATIASELTGAGQLATTDLGTLILTGENTYTGGTVVNAGTLRIGDGVSSGSILGSVGLTGGSTLAFARNDGHDFTNDVSGAGMVRINGTLTLSGAITVTNGVTLTAGSNGTVTNVSVVNGNAITGGAGSIVNIGAGGQVGSGNGNGIFFNGATGTLNNAGAIVAGGVGTSGVYGAGALTLVNATTGSITGARAVSVLQTLDLTNAGTITGTATAFNSSAISSNGAGTIVNTGSIYSGTNAVYTGGVGALTNSGLIQGGGSASTVRLIGAGSVLTNLAGGQITTTGTGVGVYLDNAGSSVTNAGTISGGNAVYLVGGGSVTNSGVLTGTAGSSVVSAGGVVTNLAGGSVTGLGNGINFNVGAGSVINAGSITGTNSHGVTFAGGGSVDNSGSISGALAGVRSSAGLNLTSSGSISGGTNAIESIGAFNDSLTFLAGSVTTGAIVSDEGDDFISLAGTLNGTLFAGGGADTVTLFDTGAFNSVLDGGDGVDVFVLDGTGFGSVAITNILNFESRVKQGTGVFTLTGGDLSTADWTINGGALLASGGDSINDAVSVTIGANGGFGLLDSETIGSLNGVGLVDLGSNVLTLADGGDYAGVISGAGGVVLNGGVLTLSGSNTWVGYMDVAGGTLELGASDVLSDQTAVRIAAGSIFDVAAFNDTVLELDLSGTLSGTGTLTATQYLLNGAVVNANLGEGLLFQQSGTSLLNGLSGASQVSINGGVLQLGASERLSDTANLFIDPNGTLDLQGFDETVAYAAISGTLAGSGTLTADTYELNGATINGNLGTGTLLQWTGLSVLNGASAASQTAIEGGVLQLGASERLLNTTSLFIGADGALDLQGFDQTVGSASISGLLDGTGTLTAAGYALDGATVNANLGAGFLVVSNFLDQVSTLNGTSMADDVLILGGVLRLGAADRLSDTATVTVTADPFTDAVGVLDIGAFSETVQNLALIGGSLNGTGTLTASQYVLEDATVNANLGAGLLVQQGGVSTLNGTSAAGLVDITGGSLILGAAERLADDAILVIRTNATLDIGAFAETVDAIGISGTLAGTGLLTASSYELSGGTVNANLGAGDLLQLSGVSTLNGTSASEAVSIVGGTLTLGASNRLSDTATLVVATGGALDLGAFNETVGLVGLAGTLNGTGILTASRYELAGATVNANLGAGDLLQLSGVSTLNGTSASQAINIAAGTLALGASNRLSDTATLVVATGGVLNMDAFNDTVGMVGLNGTLNGTGTLSAAETQLSGATINANLGGERLFNLAGVSILNGTAAQGLVSVQGGTLRLGASDRLSDTATVSVSAGATLAVGAYMDRIGALFGMGDVTIAGGGRLTFGGTESGFGGRLSGAGALVHTGGLFTLMGDHTLGSIINQGGELRFLGSTTGSMSLTGGMLTGAGTIGGTLTVSNGAILSPGLAGQQNGIGGFTLGGLNLTGGRLNLDVTGITAGSLIDQIRVLGTAVLTGGTVTPNFQGGPGAFDFSTRYLFLQANTLVGTFANGSAFTAANGAGLYWRVRYDLVANSAVMELRQLTDFDPGDAGSDNQSAVGAAFNGNQLGASDGYAAVLSVIAGLSDAQRLAAFDSASGEGLADLTTSLFSANDHFMQAVQTSGGATEDSGRSLSFASQLSLSTDRDGAANQLAGVLSAYDPGAIRADVNGGWVSVFAGDQELEGKAGQATVDTRVNGFAGGYGITHGDWTLGGAAGVSRMEGDVTARASEYESDLTHAAGYIRYDDGQWVADVTAAIYGGEVATRRMVSVGAFQGNAFGQTHAEGQAFSASIARRFHFDGGGAVALGAMATVANASVDGFTETGADVLSLQVSGLERDWQTLNLSARASQPYEVGGRVMKVYGGMGVLLTTGDREATGDMRFTGAPTGFGGFLVEGAEASPVAGVTDFGLEIEAAEGITVSAGYRGVFSERLTDNQVGIKMNVRW